MLRKRVTVFSHSQVHEILERASIPQNQDILARDVCLLGGVATHKRGIIPGGSPSRARNRGIMSRRSCARFLLGGAGAGCVMSPMRGNRESAACVTYLVGYRSARAEAARSNAQDASRGIPSLRQTLAKLKRKGRDRLTNRFLACPIIELPGRKEFR